MNHATVDNGAGGPLVDGSYIIAAAVATSNDNLVEYNGSSGSNAVGFSVTATPGDANDLLFWEAWASNCDGE